MQQSGLLDRLGEENICGDLDEAIRRVSSLLENETAGRGSPV